MKVLKPPQSGSLGDVVAKRNRYGQYETKKVAPRDRKTAAMRRVRANLGKFSSLWNDLSEEQREAWRRLARSVRSRKRLNQSGSLTGQTLFIKINTVLATCGYEPRFDPPPLPGPFDNPVVALSIEPGEKGPILRVRLSKTPSQDIMLFGSPPRNAGRQFCAEFEFLDLLPVPKGGESNITRAYTWKHGAPPPGSRVFIPAWPQQNGWEARWLGMIVSEVVPRLARVSARSKRR